MKKKSLIGHSCWAAIALAAYWLGSFGKSPSTPAHPERSGTLVSLSSEEVEPQNDKNSLLTSTGRVAPPNSGPIAKMFGDSLINNSSWETLAEQAMRDPNPIKRRLAFGKLLEALTPDNALEIREHLASAGTEGDQWRDFNYAWGALAGEEAFLFAASSKESDMAAAVAGWASANPNEAIAMLDNLPEELEGQRADLARSVVEGLSDRDRTLATDLVLRLASEEVPRTDRLMATIASDAVRVDGPESAARWTESLPDGPLKGAAMERVAGAYVERDAESAARWAESVADQEFAARAIEEVGQRWAVRNPVEAVGWLESLPEGQGQKSGLRSAFGDWEDRDPYAATEYLSNMPQSEQRDAAISGFSRGYAWQDPEVAIAWALDISDPGLRQESLTRAGQIFFRRDPASATTWLEGSGLPAKTQEAILNARGG